MGHVLFSGVLTVFAVCGKGSVILTGHRTYVPYYRAAAQTPFVLTYYDYHKPVLPSMFVNPQFGPSDRIGPILEAQSPQAGIRTVQAGSDTVFPRYGLEAAQARLGAARAPIGVLQAGTGNSINTGFAQAGLEAALGAAQERIGALQAGTGSAINTGFPQVGLDAAQAPIGAAQARIGAVQAETGNGINAGFSQAGLEAAQPRIGALQAETGSALNTGVSPPAGVGPEQTVNDLAQTGATSVQTANLPAQISGGEAPANNSGNNIWKGYSTITSVEYPSLLQKVNTALQRNGPELGAAKINFAGFKIVGHESLTGPGMINLVNFTDNSNKNCYAYLIEPTGKDAEIPKESIVCAT